MRATVRFLGVLAVGGALAGCGAEFELPTEQPGGTVGIRGSYEVVALWPNMIGVRDLLLTASPSTQLYVLVQDEIGVGPSPRGSVLEYRRTSPIPEPVRTGTFQGLFNPVALCAGGTVPGGQATSVFVLDQGDTCMARQHPVSGSCTDTTGRFNFRITHPEYYWKVVEYNRSGQTRIASFSDTLLAHVSGIAADDRGNVYVSGRAIIFVPNPFDPRLNERVFQYRVYRYARGPLPGGGADRNIIGDSWHRDPDYAIQEGSGVGTVNDPRGLYWSAPVGPALFVADLAKSWVQKMRDGNVDLGDSRYYRDEDLTGALPLSGAVDVCADRNGFFYVADEGNRRVLRYSDLDLEFVQRVDLETNPPEQTLQQPVAVAANEKEVYVADRATARVLRYVRQGE